MYNAFIIRVCMVLPVGALLSCSDFVRKESHNSALVAMTIAVKDKMEKK